MVRELIQHVGIEGCGGTSGGTSSGLDALEMAAARNHVDIMAILTDVGVTDTGRVLLYVSGHGKERPVKFLVENHKMTTTGEFAYVDYCNSLESTPLAFCIASCSSRLGRLLVDAGADVMSTIRLTDDSGEVIFNDTPLAFVSYSRLQLVVDNDAPDERMQRLEATRRLLLQVDAIHAISCLWPGGIPARAHAAKRSRWPSTSPSLTVMLPIIRRRASKPGALLVALYRYVIA